MLAGLFSLGARHALDALRERAAECGWPELFGQAIDRTGDAAILVFMALVGCAAVVLSAFFLWPLAAAATLGLSVRIVLELLRRSRS